jgi:hypothetical protein
VEFINCRWLITLTVSRPDDGLIKEGPKHVVDYCPFISNKVCCVFDYLPIFNLILLNTHNGDEPPENS